MFEVNLAKTPKLHFITVEPTLQQSLLGRKYLYYSICAFTNIRAQGNK